MTTIVRKDNWIASDSKFIIHNSGVPKIIYGGSKFYILPEKTAVVAISGTVASSNAIKNILQIVRTLVQCLHTGEEIPDFKQITGMPPTFAIMVATKKHTAIYDKEPEAEGDFNFRVSLSNFPVIIGSGEGFVGSSILFDPKQTAITLVENAYRLDELSGGDIYKFDLNKLVDLPEVTDQ